MKWRKITSTSTKTAMTYIINAPSLWRGNKDRGDPQGARRKLGVCACGSLAGLLPLPRMTNGKRSTVVVVIVY